MPGPEDILQRMLQQNPVVRNNPNNAPILNALEHRDAQSGQQLAQNYNMATNTNTVTTAIANAARDIAENQNANYRQLHDELVAYRMEDKDNTIAELRSQVNALNLSASQSNQNAYLVAQLKTPAPVPAYTVPNPNAYYGCQQNCYQSCGC